MDSFLKSMEERAMARRDLINKLADHVGSAPQAKRPLEDQTVSNKVVESSPKRLCSSSRLSPSQDKENDEGFFFSVRNNSVKGLAALKPGHRPEPGEPLQQLQEQEPPAPKEVGQLKKKLADLAARFSEQGEDEDLFRPSGRLDSNFVSSASADRPLAKHTTTSLSKPLNTTTTPSKSTTAHLSKPLNPTTTTSNPLSSPPQTPKPKTPLDRSVVRTLESQGYVKTPSESRLAFAFNGPSPAPGKPAEKPAPLGLASSSSATEKSPRRIEPASQQQDPSALPLAKRMALFEQKSQNFPARPPANPEKLSISERVRLFEKAAQDSAEGAKKVFHKPAPFFTRAAPACLEQSPANAPAAPTKHVEFGRATVIPYQPEEETAEESSLYPETEEDVTSMEEEGCAYLSDPSESAKVEPEDSACPLDSSDPNQMEHTFETDDYTDVYTEDSRTFDEETLEETQVLNNNADLLEVSSEMTQGEEEDLESSQEPQAGPADQEELNKYRSPLPAVPSKEEEGQRKSGLFYTLSFYRKQQQQLSTPGRPVIRKEFPIVTDTEEELASEPEDQTALIQEHIQLLEEEAQHHTTVIGQTSQALSLCYSTPEFHHSQEQLAAERLLLIHTQKRHACLMEIQRLKREGVFGSGRDTECSSANLSVSEVCLSLRGDPQTEPNVVHYFICLLRCGPTVYATETLALSEAKNQRLTFPNYHIFHSIASDFQLVLEVYALTTKKEELPEDKKYHIKKNKGKGWLTKKESKLFSPAVSSPGGPHAVRTPQFTLLGSAKVNIRSHNRQAFALEKVPFTTALDGLVTMKIKLSVEYTTKLKGFLTMFEEVGGFGAWQRRWCYLQGTHILYWKYPENEEQQLQPLGMLDLSNCVTEKVEAVPRDICCRPNTFQLVMVRPSQPGDRSSLISDIQDSFTRTKHLLSADSKEERILWCKRLNTQLGAMRRWDHQQL